MSGMSTDRWLKISCDIPIIRFGASILFLVKILSVLTYYQNHFAFHLFLLVFDYPPCTDSIAEKCFDIWGILKKATVKTVEPGNITFGVNHIIRCRSKLLPL